MSSDKEYGIRPVMDDLLPEMYIGSFLIEDYDYSPQGTVRYDNDYSVDTSVMDY